jgi:beta-N-acetylhexosaminidase
VLDVLTNAKNPAIGDRALSDRAEEVARHGRVIVETLQGAGIAAAGKHFPGHGDTGVDSHLDLPICELPPDRLRAIEFVPFRAAIEARVAFMLTCHVLYPALDEEHPATLSPRIVQGLLRDELRFDGAILTDDLDMKAIADRYTIEDTVARAIAAGCDGLLICGGDHDKKVRALEGLIRAAEAEKAFARRVEDALARMRRAKQRFLAGPAFTRADPVRIRAALGLLDHQMVAEEMRQWL